MAKKGITRSDVVRDRITKVIKYQTVDGALFDTEHEAKLHDSFRFVTGQQITSIKKDWDGYHLTLSNGVTLTIFGDGGDETTGTDHKIELPEGRGEFL